MFEKRPVFELRRLRMLRELQLRGTIAAVAHALSYSPSTVSQQLAQLEREAGAPLLAPDGRRVRLTPHGVALAAHAARALDLDERVRGELESVRPDLAPVRVAVFQSAAHAIVPRALTLLAARHPLLRVEIAERPPEEGLFEVSARGVDLVVAEQYPGRTREHREAIRREPLGRDPIRLALPPDHAARRMSDLAHHPWVLEPEGTAARDWAVQQCREAGFEPDVRFETADLIAHIRLIAGGHAAGLLPDLVWAGDVPPVRLRELPGSPHREVFAATRDASAERPGVRAVLEALHSAVDAATRGDGA